MTLNAPNLVKNPLQNMIARLILLPSLLRNNIPSIWGNEVCNAVGEENIQFRVESKGKIVAQNENASEDMDLKGKVSV